MPLDIFLHPTADARRNGENLVTAIRTVHHHGGGIVHAGAGTNYELTMTIAIPDDVSVVFDIGPKQTPTPPDYVTVEGIVAGYFVDDYHSEVGVCSDAIGYPDAKGMARGTPYWEISPDGQELLRDALDALRGHAVRVTVELLSEPWGKRRVDKAGNVIWIAAQPEGDAADAAP